MVDIEKICKSYEYYYPKTQYPNNRKKMANKLFQKSEMASVPMPKSPIIGIMDIKDWSCQNFVQECSKLKFLEEKDKRKELSSIYITQLLKRDQASVPQLIEDSPHPFLQNKINPFEVDRDKKLDTLPYIDGLLQKIDNITRLGRTRINLAKPGTALMMHVDCYNFSQEFDDPHIIGFYIILDSNDYSYFCLGDNMYQKKPGRIFLLDTDQIEHGSCNLGFSNCYTLLCEVEYKHELLEQVSSLFLADNIEE